MNNLISDSLQRTFNLLIKPRSRNKDESRREFVLNVLLIGSIIISGIVFIDNLAVYMLTYPKSHSFSPLITFLLLPFLLTLLVISRRNHVKLSASIFISLIFLVPTYTIYGWGADVPQALLTFALLVVIAGILINTMFAFLVIMLSGLMLLIVTSFQQNGIIAVDSYWKSQPLKMEDTVISVITLIIIGVVSWLFNRQSEKALHRARISEAALKKERDLLEVKVEERTRELKKAQMEKMAQLYRFAEIGRFSSGLFHDLVNPLNLVSLNLEKISAHNKTNKEKELVNTKVLLGRAIAGTKKLESFITAARSQLHNQDIVEDFILGDEINEVIRSISYLVKKFHVELVFHKPFFKAKLHGNPVLFYRLITNLLVNAIESYEINSDKNRRQKVVISIVDQEDSLRLIIHDWGKGIARDNLSKIFDPFFTTKPHKASLGIGLSICKEIVENSFKGRIYVESYRDRGTKIILDLPK